VVKRSIINLENQISDMEYLPNQLCEGLINPLLKSGAISLNDLSWYTEEDKDELFDLRGQYFTAALILDA
jgi:hypothetical protein